MNKLWEKLQVSFEDSVFEHSSWVVGCWDKSSEVVGYTEEVWGISVVISKVKCSDLILIKVWSNKKSITKIKNFKKTKSKQLIQNRTLNSFLRTQFN